MLIYEINLSVDTEIANEYASWLREHIREMLEEDGFESAAWYTRKVDGQNDRRYWTIHYHVTDQERLSEYIENRAEVMRQAGLKRFANKFEADRRVLEQNQVFS